MASAPPGWHPDHSDPELLRYWDGSAWTTHTHPRDAGGDVGRVRPAETHPRDAKRQAKESARAAKQAEEERRAYLASPIGLAEVAAQRGDRFFQVEIPHSTVTGYSSDFMFAPHWDTTNTNRNDAAPDLLGRIEQHGWRLVHANWVFVQTGSSSREKVLSTGEKSTVVGRVDGIYLFRAAERQT